MNAGGWQPVIGWATVRVSAVTAAYSASLRTDEPRCKPKARWPRFALLLCVTVLIVYLLLSHGLPYIWPAIGMIYAGDLLAECRRPPINRAKVTANLLFVLGFFTLGLGEMTDLTALSVAAFLLVGAGWLTLIVSADWHPASDGSGT